MNTRQWLFQLFTVILLTACSTLYASIPTPTPLPTVDLSWLTAPRPTPNPASLFPAMATPLPLPESYPKIDRHPLAFLFRRGNLSSFPHFDPNSTNPFQIDLRSYDLSYVELLNSLDDLRYADFDDQTVWPTADMLPSGFDWRRIRELGMNPGLGVRSLHAQGITGRGVGIGIIDQSLLVDHEEYKAQLRLYEETEEVAPLEEGASMHAAAVASIAVGKTVGVAPQADLYFIATNFGNASSYEYIDFSYLARGIRRILQINQQLPEGRKIRVISASVGWVSKSIRSEEVKAAVKEAQAAGLLVVTSSIQETFGFTFQGLGRDPLKDPDDFASYEPGFFWAKGYYGGNQVSDRLLVPMDSRTTASPTGVNDYVFYRISGWSWSIPYIAGIYALAAQVNPRITPEKFWETALKTGHTLQVQHDGQNLPLGQILDPVALIAALK